jgi:multidrug efflux pump subunit AcrA (membrane-fusion protein)
VIPLASGKSTEVLGDEGQAVRAGQTLARIDRTSLELSLRQAEAALASSQAQLDRTRAGSTAEDIAAAQAALISAQASLQDLMDGPSESELKLAQLAVDQAKNSLYSAQGSRDATVGSDYSSGGAKTQAEAAVLNAEVAVQIAECNWRSFPSRPSSPPSRPPACRWPRHRPVWTNSLTRPPPRTWPSPRRPWPRARSAWISPANNWTTPTSWPRPTVNWPPGILYVGDTVAAGQSIGTVIDNSGYHIDLQVDELSIAAVANDQDAHITLDAFPDDELAGHVSRIAAIGTSTQGLVTYQVTVALDPTDLMVRPFMTASVDIVTARKEDALTVSNRALRRDANGKYVEIVKNGVTSKAYVETGLSNSDITEIVSGLEAGDQVVVSSTGSSLLSGSPFGGV